VRRANGQGSIYFQKSRGLYAAAIDQGFINGKRRRKIVFGKTVREVAEKLPHLQVAQQTGMLPPGKGQKLGAYLAWWIAQRPANRTTRGYAQIIDNHIAPALGRIPLDKVAATHIDAMLNALRGKVSDTTRHHIRAVLSVSLAYAERKNLVPRNVARLAEPITMPTYKSVYSTSRRPTRCSTPRRAIGSRRSSPSRCTSGCARASCWACAGRTSTSSAAGSASSASSRQSPAGRAANV
jgi:hypothetical protein